jgi:hypothetical protein
MQRYQFRECLGGSALGSGFATRGPGCVKLMLSTGCSSIQFWASPVWPCAKSRKPTPVTFTSSVSIFPTLPTVEFKMLVYSASAWPIPWRKPGRAASASRISDLPVWPCLFVGKISPDPSKPSDATWRTAEQRGKKACRRGHPAHWQSVAGFRARGRRVRFPHGGSGRVAGPSSVLGCAEKSSSLCGVGEVELQLAPYWFAHLRDGREGQQSTRSAVLHPDQDY